MEHQEGVGHEAHGRCRLDLICASPVLEHRARTTRTAQPGCPARHDTTRTRHKGKIHGKVCVPVGNWRNAQQLPQVQKSANSSQYVDGSENTLRGGKNHLSVRRVPCVPCVRGRCLFDEGVFVAGGRLEFSVVPLGGGVQEGLAARPAIQLGDFSERRQLLRLQQMTARRTNRANEHVANIDNTTRHDTHGTRHTRRTHTPVVVNGRVGGGSEGYLDEHVIGQELHGGLRRVHHRSVQRNLVPPRCATAQARQSRLTQINHRTRTHRTHRTHTQHAHVFGAYLGQYHRCVSDRVTRTSSGAATDSPCGRNHTHKSIQVHAQLDLDQT
jgi:hypothetical protein